jgi:hypothetical protein
MRDDGVRPGVLEGESQDKGGVGVRPGRDQKRHEPATLGKIDVDRVPPRLLQKYALRVLASG